LCRSIASIQKIYKLIAVLVLDDFRLGPKVQERRSVCLEGDPVDHGQRDPRRHRLQPTTQSGHGNRFVKISKNKQSVFLKFNLNLRNNNNSVIFQNKNRK
jgi:hypothetical protein